MTGSGPTSQSPLDADEQTPPQANPAVERAARMNAANMARSLLPLVLICLVIVWWTSFRQSADVQPIREIDPSSTVDLAAARAGYQVLVPQGLDEEYRPTSARTDAGDAGEGDPVTLQIGYVTPSEEFAGFVVSDDRRADAVAEVLDGAQDDGTVDVDGESWTRSTTEKDETALWRETDGVIVVVSGSASEAELATVAGAVEPYSA
jgi:cytoskeletal protein RodZ